MRRNLFARKPLKADFTEIDVEHPHTLKRHLGSFQLTLIGIGAIIGAGIFVVTGKAAALYAGPAVVLSFILAFIICALTGLCYAELSALIPIAGGSYSFAYVALGELPAWVIGWSVSGQYLLASSTVAAGWSGYLTSFLEDFGITLSQSLTTAPLTYSPESGLVLSGAILNIPAVLLAIGVGFIISIGIKTVTRFNTVMVFIKLATVILFVVLGIGHVDAENWRPFIPDNTGIFGGFGFSGIMRAAGLVFFAYIGFDTVSTLALDAKNPQKDLPRGILGSLIICTAAYIIVSFVLTGVVSYTELNVADPMAVALNAMGPSVFWIASLIKIAILAGLASVVLIVILGQTRIFLAIGKDGLLPAAFAKIHPKFKSPVFTSLFTAAIAAILAGLFPIDVLGQLVSMMTLFIFAIVCLTVLVLRYSHPEFHRPFKAPLSPWLPSLGILACLFQMFALPLVTWLQTLIWLLIGLITYFCYGLRHSKLS